MRSRLIVFLIFALGGIMTLRAGDPSDLLHIRITTALGTIEAELDPVHAPRTVANFLRYVDAGRYAGGQFHRTVKIHPDNQPASVVKIEVIQGGVNPRVSEKNWAPLELERTSVTTLSHVDGTLSMARAGVDTATSDFFICIGEQPDLNFGGKRNPDGQGFAAFGRVTHGMDVVRKIQAAPADHQTLTPPVVIESIARAPSASPGR
jgi:peptidyl-prolyl cis-trans isomerase A (cyclophilin A)